MQLIDLLYIVIVKTPKLKSRFIFCLSRILVKNRAKPTSKPHIPRVETRGYDILTPLGSFELIILDASENKLSYD